MTQEQVELLYNSVQNAINAKEDAFKSEEMVESNRLFKEDVVKLCNEFSTNFSKADSFKESNRLLSDYFGDMNSIIEKANKVSETILNKVDDFTHNQIVDILKGIYNVDFTITNVGLFNSNRFSDNDVHTMLSEPTNYLISCIRIDKNNTLIYNLINIDAKTKELLDNVKLLSIDDLQSMNDMSYVTSVVTPLTFGNISKVIQSTSLINGVIDEQKRSALNNVMRDCADLLAESVIKIGEYQDGKSDSTVNSTELSDKIN